MANNQYVLGLFPYWLYKNNFFLQNRDRLRTAVNILGDSIGAGIVAHLCRNDLDQMNNEEDSQIDDNNMPLENISHKIRS